jgi:uncharacterized membrane protein HdeD (DUF308 family)
LVCNSQAALVLGADGVPAAVAAAKNNFRAKREAVMAGEMTMYESALRADVATMRQRWGWFVAAGLVMLILGVIGVVYAVATTALWVMLFGALLAIGGVVELVHAFTRSAGWGAFFVDLLAGALYLVAGGLLLFNPAASAIALTLLIAMLLIVSGIFRAIASIAVRPPVWGWSLVHGIVSVVLGAFIWSQWPISGLWLIGMVVGIELLLNGITLLSIGLMARTLPLTTERPTAEEAGGEYRKAA